MNNEITYSIDPNVGSFSVSIDGDPYVNTNGTWNIVGQNIPSDYSAMGFVGTYTPSQYEPGRCCGFSGFTTSSVQSQVSFSGSSIRPINPSLEYRGKMPTFRID